MNANLLKKLTSIRKQDSALSKNVILFSKVEYEIARSIMEKNEKNIEAVIKKTGRDSRELITSINQKMYPIGIPKKSKSAKRKKAPKSLTMFEQFQTTYKLDNAFFSLVRQTIDTLSLSFPQGQSMNELFLPDTWSLHKTSLAKRAIVLGLAQAWTKNKTDEPILWKISTVLKTISKGSIYAVSESITQICLTGTIEYFQQQESIATFFKDINTDKSGNILDNLAISNAVYQSLQNSGWKPDRREIENFPMTFDMFLEFMQKKGFERIFDIDDVLEIGLKNSLEDYRYQGSPFLSKDDIKKVKIVASGWKYKGDLVIRPKVNEISSKE